MVLKRLAKQIRLEEGAGGDWRQTEPCPRHRAAQTLQASQMTHQFLSSLARD